MVETVQTFLILLYLLPGIVGYFFFVSLSGKHFKDNFHKVGVVVTISFLSAFFANLIFRIQVLPELLDEEQGSIPAILNRFFEHNFFLALIFGIIVGIIFAFETNYNFLTRIFYRLKITFLTGKDDVWDQVVVTQTKRKWCQIRFDDGKLLLGWIKYYSHSPERDALFLSDAVWTFNPMRPNGPKKTVQIKGPGVLITNFEKVTAIEIWDGKEEEK